MLKRRRHRSPLRRRPGAARRLGHGRDRQGHLRAGPQRRRQDQLMRAIVGQQAISGGKITSTARTSRPAAQRGARAAGIAFVPQGREIFPLLTVKENLETGLRAAAPQGPLHSRRAVRPVPGAEVDAGPARRRPLGWPAAATRHRAGAGHPAEIAGAGRADRGHPALDHQGYRPRHRLSALSSATWRSCWSSSISTSPANSPTRCS
jgi:hypothetical protein